MNKFSSTLLFLGSNFFVRPNRRFLSRKAGSELLEQFKICPQQRNGFPLIKNYVKCCVLVCLGCYVTHRVKKGYNLKFLNSVNALSINKNDNKETNSRSNNFIADVVEKVASAVVYIEVIGRHPYTGQEIIVSNGSGFIVQSDGLILTNAHVVENERQVRCKLHDGRIFKAVVTNRDLQKDLATLRINASNLPTIELGDSSKLRPGEFVVAMGSPLSLSNTITAGVISSVYRSSKELGLAHSDMDYIQTDASINFGNSGGPLVNLDGEAIGINTMKVTAGISFAIPADYAKEFLKNSQSKKGDDMKKHYIGITMLTLTPTIVAELFSRNITFPTTVEHGVLIWKMIQNSPAHKAGLQLGDVITHINKNPIKSSKDVYQEIKKGTSMTMTVIRNNTQLELLVTPVESY